MREPVPSPEWKVTEIIERCSGAPVVFSRFRMACVGCVMAPFETLADAAIAYGLKPESLLREFRRPYRENPKPGPGMQPDRNRRDANVGAIRRIGEGQVSLG